MNWKLLISSVVLAACQGLYAQLPPLLLQRDRIHLIDFATIVRDELKLTVDQARQLEVLQEMRDVLVGMEVVQAWADADREAAKILTPQQLRRIEQLRFQIELHSQDPFDVLTQHDIAVPDRKSLSRAIYAAEMKLRGRVSEMMVSQSRSALLRVFTEQEIDRWIGEPFPFQKPYGLFEVPLNPDKSIHYADRQTKPRSRPIRRDRFKFDDATRDDIESESSKTVGEVGD